jgi:hypothetical protein
MAMRLSGASPRSKRHSSRNMATKSCIRIFWAPHFAVCGQQIGIEQAATGIGVDFDQPWAGFGEVEVVAEKDAALRPAAFAGNGGRLGQRPLSGRPARRSPIRWQ